MMNDTTDKITVSVVMANYNTPLEYLKESVDSILNQKNIDFEFVIIDDASTDYSVEYLKSIDDERVKLYINDNNLGLTKSLNIGLNHSRGKYIARMDSDDISLPNRLKKQVDFMENNPDVIVCGTWFEKFGIEQCIRKPVIEDFELYRCQLMFSNTPITVCHPSVIMRKSMLDEYNIRYDESIKKAQDYAMWVECSQYGRIAILKEVLLRYRTHPKQISMNQVSEQQTCAKTVSMRQLNKLGITSVEEVPNRGTARIVNYQELLDEIIANNKSVRFISDESLLRYQRQFLTDEIGHLTWTERLKLLKNKDMGHYLWLYLKKKVTGSYCI